MKCTIGICSYNNFSKLTVAIASIQQHATTDYELLIVDNNSTDDNTLKLLHKLHDSRTARVIFNPDNKRYAGAVNQIFKEAKNEYVIYCDNDIQILSPRFDEVFIGLLENNKDIGWVSSSRNGAMPLDFGVYEEVSWAVGCCFASTKKIFEAVGGIDETLLHQNDPDFCIRLRMAGYRVVASKVVHLHHNCSSTNSPEQQDNINKGVMQFINKWNKYFLGVTGDYFSPAVMRWDDFPLNRVHACKYFKSLNLNKNPEILSYRGQKYDLIKIPMFVGSYRNLY